MYFYTISIMHHIITIEIKCRIIRLIKGTNLTLKSNTAEVSMQGGQSPPMKILGGGKTSFCPLNNFDNLKDLECNARIGLKSIVRHYKTIKFYIKILLNIHNFQFACKILYCSFFLPPPHPKNGSAPLQCIN